MEYWDIYDEKKQKTGRTMKRNDWNMKPDEYHLTVLGVLKRPDGRYLITQRKLDKEWGAGWWEVPGGGVNAGEDSREINSWMHNGCSKNAVMFTAIAELFYLLKKMLLIKKHIRNNIRQSTSCMILPFRNYLILG